jgi:Lar family restriction alleviation protein
MDYIYNKTATGCSIPIRPCPFCGSEAQLVLAHDQVRRGIQCSACSACVPPLHKSEFEAMMRWNRRSGGVAGAGGRATRGISTAKKRRACRKNLTLARKAKLLIRLKAKTDAAIAQLRSYREAEGRELEELARRSRSRIAALLPLFDADPGLRGLAELLEPGQAADGAGHVVQSG